MRWERFFSLIVLLATACSVPLPGGPSRGGPAEAARPSRAMVMVVRTEGVTAAAKGLQTIGVRGAPVAMFNAGLVYQDEKLVPHPELAEALPQLNTDQWQVLADGRMETTYRLKAGLTWQDGTTLSAEDFVFALNVYQNPRYGVSSPKPQNAIDRAQAPDDRTLIIYWNQPFSGAGELLAADLQALPRHLLAAQLDQLDPDAFAAHPFWTTAYVGLGPYRIERWDPGVGLEAVAFDHYVHGRPKIDRVRVVYMEDPNTALANLLSGAVDVAISNAIPFNQALTLRAQWGDRGRVLATPRGSRTTEFQLHPERLAPTLTATLDVRVRRALAHAIDKEGINEAVFEGQGLPADTRVLPTLDYFGAADRAISKYPFDLRRSEQLMNEAGYVKGPDGIFASADGSRFEGQDWISANAQSELTQAIMLNTWKRAGFDLASHFISQAEEREARIRAERPGLYTGDGGSLETLGSDSIPTPENRWTGSNRGSYSSPQYDKALLGWTASLDRGERVRDLVEMARIYSEDLPSIPIHYNLGVSAHTAALKGVVDEATEIHLWEWIG